MPFTFYKYFLPLSLPMFLIILSEYLVLVLEVSFRQLTKDVHNDSQIRSALKPLLLGGECIGRTWNWAVTSSTPISPSSEGQGETRVKTPENHSSILNITFSLLDISLGFIKPFFKRRSMELVQVCGCCFFKDSVGKQEIGAS